MEVCNMKMKILLAASALLLCLACAREELATEDRIVDSHNSASDIVFSAVSPSTKTMMGESVEGKRPVYWCEGDRICVNSVVSAPLESVSENATEVVFRVGGPLDAPFKGLYPASFYTDASTITLPAVQVWKSGSFANGSYPMASYTQDQQEEMAFRFLCSMIKLSIKQDASQVENTDKIASVVFRGNDEEQVCGAFTIDYQNATLTSTSSSDNDKIVGVIVNQALSTDKALDIYLVVPAKVYDAGFTFSVIDTQGRVMKKVSNKSQTLKAGIIAKLPELVFVPNSDVEDENIPECLLPQEWDVTEDGEPIVMYFGARIADPEEYIQPSEDPAPSETEGNANNSEGEEGSDEEGTKTHLGTLADSKYPNYWSVGDKVKINGDESAGLGEEYATPSKTARFPMVKWVEKYDGYYNVGYPAEAFAFSEGVGTVTLSSTQTYVAGSYDPKAFVLIGKSEEEALDFIPVMGLLRVTAKNADGGGYGSKITSVTLQSIGGEALSGTFTTDYTNGSSDFFKASSGNSSVTISAPDPEVGLDFGTQFFFCIPAGTYAKGLRFIVTTLDGKSMVFSNAQSKTVTVGSMTALTSPAYTPTEEQGAPTLVEITPSSFYVQWATSGKETNDYAKRWRIDVWTNAECTGNPVRTIEIYPKAGCWPSSTTPLRFVVGRMTPQTAYYVKVTDVGNGNTSPARSITLSELDEYVAPVQMPGSNITTTGEILREDFSEIGWSASYYNMIVAGGFYPTTSVDGTAFVNTKQFRELDTDENTTFKTNTDLWGFHLDRFNIAYPSSRLADWLYYSYNYFMPGYIKMGKEDAAGYLFTPAIPLAAGKTAVVSVEVKAAKYDNSSTGDVAVGVVKGVTCGYPVDGTDGHFYRRAKSGYAWPSSSDASLYGSMNFAAKTWSTQTVNNLCMSDGDRIIIGMPPGSSASGGAARLNLASVTLTVTDLVDYVIYDATTLNNFRTAIADAVSAGKSTNIPACVVANFDAGDSWTPIDGYTGTLDGQGHIITGLTKPMFATLSGTVKNLTLNSSINQTEDDDTIEDAGTGIFAQTLTNGTLMDCVSKGSVNFSPSVAITNGHSRYVGGMVGWVPKGGSGSMIRCTNYASISVPHNSKTNSMHLEVGGLIGHLDNTSGGTISNLQNLYSSGEGANSGKVSVSLIVSTNTTRNYRIGGVIGYVTSGATVISNCTNSGVVEYVGSGNCTCNLRVGGIVGHMRKGASGCQNSGNVSVAATASIQKGYLALGGLAGLWNVPSTDGGTLSGSSNTGTISNAGTVHKSDYSLHACVGGLIGRTTGAILTSTKAAYNYNNGQVQDSSNSDNIDIGGICGYTDGSQSASDFTFCQNLSGGVVTVGSRSGSTQSTPYNINISGILALADGESAAAATLTSAINSGAINVYGTSINGNLNVGGVLAQTNGLFPAISGSSTDLTTNNGAITFTNNNLAATSVLHIGGVWGWRDNMNTGTVEHCKNTATITANADVGGLTTVKTNSNFSCVGGIIGGGGDDDDTPATINMTVSNCSNTGTIYLSFLGRLFMGGIIGSVKTAPSYCSNQANVSMGRGENATGFSAVGGIVGYHRSSSRTFSNLSHSGQVGNADAVVCYASGLIGYTNGNCTFNSCSIRGQVRCHDFNPGLFFSYPDRSTVEEGDKYRTITCSSCTVKSGTKVVSSSGTTTISSLSNITTNNIVGGFGVASLPASGLSVN